MLSVLAHAEKLAAETRSPLTTGHLLLATLTGQGTAANLLRLRGLTDGMIRSRLKAAESEPHSTVPAVVDKARQIAASFKIREPSPLHLLAALAGSKGSRAVAILTEVRLDAMAIRTAALRCLTGVTEEHSPSPKRRAASLPDPGGIIPPLAELKGLAARTRAAARGSRAEAPRADRAAPAAVAPQRPTRTGTRKMIDAGLDLESKQRRTRAQRIPSATGAAKDARAGAAREPAPVRRDPASRRPVRRAPLPEAASSFALTPDRFPLLHAMGRNITALAARGDLEPIVGRAREMERMADVLNKRRANSPCLVGPAGVGKTAVVEGLAAAVFQGALAGLEDRIVIEVRPADLLAGTSVRGALAERVAGLRAEVAQAAGRIILFFDEFHTLLASSDGAEAIQELKAALGRGELPCIAATTSEEYVKHVESDPALARRFSVIEVAEPSEAEAIEILAGVAPAYATHHGVDYGDGALEAAVRLSARYLHDRALPDKAIALLDLAGSRVHRAARAKVEPRDVAEVLAEQLGVPAERLAASDRERLLGLEEELGQRIVGHRHVLGALAETLRRNAAGFRSGRPIGSFLFLGPTGVGKTETAKAVADILFPGGSAMVRIDMSELAEAHGVARLVGAPPGYIGHEEGGQLTEAVRRRPYCVVLLDEIEKAHPEVLQVLLQVLDDGRLTDGLGRTVSFTNTVIAMTSNLGANLGAHGRPVGFGAARRPEEPGDLAGRIIAAARGALPPELWNRIDEPLVFGPLRRDEVLEIARLMLGRVAEQLAAEQRVELAVGEGAVETLLACGGFDPELGARPMRRTVQRLVEGPVARMVLTGELKPGATVRITGDGRDLGFAVSDLGEASLTARSAEG